MAAGADRPDAAVHRVGPGRTDRPGDLLAVRSVPRVRDLPAARPGDRDGRGQPARQRAQVAGAGPLLPLVHLPVHPDPVRRAGARLLAVVERQTEHARRHRARADDGGGQRRGDQHRARARAQARELGALAEQGRAGAERLRALLHRAQPRPPRARRDAGGPGELAAGRELLGVPAAHGERQPEVGLGARVRAPGPHGQVPLEPAATTSSTRGR